MELSVYSSSSRSTDLVGLGSGVGVRNWNDGLAQLFWMLVGLVSGSCDFLLKPSLGFGF